MQPPRLAHAVAVAEVQALRQRGAAAERHAAERRRIASRICHERIAIGTKPDCRRYAVGGGRNLERRKSQRCAARTKRHASVGRCRGSDAAAEIEFFTCRRQRGNGNQNGNLASHFRSLRLARCAVRRRRRRRRRRTSSGRGPRGPPRIPSPPCRAGGRGQARSPGSRRSCGQGPSAAGPSRRAGS